MLRPLNPTLADQLDLPNDRGIVVNEVLPDSAAARAGIKPHDIVLEVNGQPISNRVPDFTKLIQELKSDVPVEAVVMRKGRREVVKDINLPEPPKDDRAEREAARLAEQKKVAEETAARQKMLQEANRLRLEAAAKKEKARTTRHGRRLPPSKHKVAEEAAARKKAMDEAKQKKADEDAARKKIMDEAARKRAEEITRKLEETVRKKVEEEAVRKKAPGRRGPQEGRGSHAPGRRGRQEGCGVEISCGVSKASTRHIVRNIVQIRDRSSGADCTGLTSKPGPAGPG